jgi:hypothetical protein
VDSEDYFIVKAELHVTLASDNGKRWEVWVPSLIVLSRHFSGDACETY